MRIRKNANLLSFMSSHASGPEALQTRVCQLNQSPWDVIPFAEDTCPWSLHHQFEGEDSFNGNGSLGDSVCAVESVVSVMEDGEERAVTIMSKTDNMVIDDNYEMERQWERKRVFEDYEVMETIGKSERIHGRNISTPEKAGDKRWQYCKNEPKQGHAICDHPSTVLKSQTTNTVGINNDGNNKAASCLGLISPPSIKKPEKGIMTGTRRGRPRAAASKKGSSSSSSNPYEFYYYSGFGPLWGKRRGDKGEGQRNEAKDHYKNCSSTTRVDPPATATVSQDTTSSWSSEFDYGYYNADHDEDDNVNGDSGSKKRMRKPVKARSLKSLM